MLRESRRAKDAQFCQLDMPAFLESGGEMGTRIHAYDWAATPVGPIERWPASFSSAVALMLAMPQPACIYWGPEALFLYNDDFRELIGDKHPGALAQPFAALWPELVDAVRPGLNAVLSGESLRITDQEFAIADGSSGQGRLEPRWFTGSWTPIRDGLGRVGGIFCATTETTEHVLTLRALRWSEARLAGQKEAFQAAVNGAPLAEALGVLVHTTIEQLGGGARCAFYIADAGKTELHHVVGMPDSYARSIDGFRVGPDSLSCGLAVYTGCPITTADVAKEPLWHDWLWLAEEHQFRACWSFPIETTTDNYVGTFAMYFKEPREASASDLELAATMTRAAAIIIARYQASDERERAEQAQSEARQAAEEAARAREEFLSIASHELRNPVTTLVGTAQLLRRARERGRLTNARLDAYLDSLERAGHHLAVLTNDLLDVSRLERGELPLRPVLTDVAELLRDIVRRCEWPSHRVDLEIPHEPPEAVIDPDRICQLVTNLLNNAVKYSPAADEVRLRLRRQNMDAGEGLLIEVEDFGIGLPLGSTDAIFTPFTRAPNAANAGIPGLGLGLYISRRVAEQHGGRLWALSQGEGRGTIMSLWLPLRIAEPLEL